MNERKTEITIETYEVLVVGRRGRISRRWCASCGKQVAAVSLNAKSLSDLSEESIGQQAQSGRFHLIKAVSGPSLICLNSLLQSWKGEQQCKAEM